MNAYSFNIDLHIDEESLEKALDSMNTTMNSQFGDAWSGWFITNFVTENGEAVSDERLGEAGH